MTLKEQWAEDAAERIAQKVLVALTRHELEDAARKIDAAPNTPRVRQITQFVATAAVLRNEAEQL